MCLLACIILLFSRLPFFYVSLLDNFIAIPLLVPVGYSVTLWDINCRFNSFTLQVSPCSARSALAWPCLRSLCRGEKVQKAQKAQQNLL